MFLAVLFASGVCDRPRIERNGRSIMLDAGHYGYYNRSPAVPSYYESQMVWKLHLMLKEELEAYGFTVGTTRSDINTDLALYNRGYASRGYDLFISVHSNAVGSAVNEDVDYPVAFTQISGASDDIGLRLAQCVQNVMGTRQAGMILKQEDSGHDYYGVLRGATAAGTVGCIIEHSFHTNTRATNWLLVDSNLRLLAQAEARVINEYFGGSGGSSGSSSSSQLKFGDQGSAVSTLQTMLNTVGFNCGEVDGSFGYATQDALKLFQSAYGLQVDGVYGPASKTALEAAYNAVKSAGTEQLAFGSNGKAVKTLQKMLNSCGYTCGEPDGSFGANTEKAVKAFQADYSLTVDGLYGPSSKSALEAAYNKLVAKFTTVATCLSSEVNVRAGAGMSHTVIYMIDKAGSNIKIDGKKSGTWVRILFDGVVGWIHRDHVLYSNSIAPQSNGKKIMLDAGHAGYCNQSPVVTSYWESQMNWKLHLMLKEELEKYGFVVGTTRSNIDEDPALYDRGYASYGYDFFISLHSNAAADTVTDFPLVLTQVSGKTDDIGLKLAQCVERVMGTTQSGRTWSRWWDDHDYYGVLRGAAAAGTLGVIIEHSCHTNARATNWLLNDSNLRKMAQEEAKIMNEYFGGSGSSSSSSSSTFKATGKATCNDNGVNIRSGPSTSHSVIGSMNKGGAMEVGKTSGLWYEIKTGNTVGWMHGDYVTLSFTKTGTATCTDDSVNIRAGPDTAFRSFGLVNKGTAMEVDGVKSGVWVHIKVNGVVGWMHSDYVK